jgi:hypothetical protein
MLAATAQPEFHALNDHLSQLMPQLSRPVFRAAYRELCTRIWIELELLAQAIRQLEGCPSQNELVSPTILRLELVVLIDSCRSPRWRYMLSGGQRDRLCSMLTDVLAALYVESEQLRSGIADAQDRVLEELIPESEPGLPPLDSADACGHDPISNPAVEELMRLIEGKAAARALQDQPQLRYSEQLRHFPDLVPASASSVRP